MKKQDKQLEKLLFEVYDKGVKQQDCNLTECIENVKQALRIHDVSGQLPDFLYEDEGQIKIGYHGDTVVTDEWNKWKEGNLR